MSFMQALSLSVLIQEPTNYQNVPQHCGSSDVHKQYPYNSLGGNNYDRKKQPTHQKLTS